MIEAQSPPSIQQERSATLEEIWPSIQIANDKSASSYRKIAKDLVLFTSDNKPMVRVGKGSVLRDKTAELYRLDLDKMFRGHAEFPPPTDN